MSVYPVTLHKGLAPLRVDIPSTRSSQAFTAGQWTDLTAVEFNDSTIQRLLRRGMLEKVDRVQVTETSPPVVTEEEVLAILDSPEEPDNETEELTDEDELEPDSGDDSEEDKEED